MPVNKYPYNKNEYSIYRVPVKLTMYSTTK